MKKLKIVGILPIIFLLLIGLVSAVAFTTKINKPSANEVIAGTAFVANISASDNANYNVTRCALLAYSTLTANSSYTLIFNQSNSTYGPGEQQNSTIINKTFDTNIFQDANNYIFKAICYNQTDNTNPRLTAVESAEITGIRIDNTLPVISSVTPASAATDDDGDVTFTVNIPAWNVTQNGVMLYFTKSNPFGIREYVMTEGTSSSTLTLSSMPEINYEWYVSATDGTNSTSIALRDLIVDFGESGFDRARKAAILAQTNPDIVQTGPRTFTINQPENSALATIKDNIKNILIIGAIIFVVIGGVLYFTKKS